MLLSLPLSFFCAVPLRRADHSFGRVPPVVCLIVYYLKSLHNEAVWVRVGLLQHRKKK